MAKTFKLTGDLMGNIDQFDSHMQKSIRAAAFFVAPQAEQYMKANAKWTDQTGAARSGLTARVDSGDPNHIAIVLYHTVSYGVFLEVRWGGKYAIIAPTVNAMAPVFLQAIRRLAFNK